MGSPSQTCVELILWSGVSYLSYRDVYLHLPRKGNLIMKNRSGVDTLKFRKMLIPYHSKEFINHVVENLKAVMSYQ